jgi:hypothetical protein
MLLLHDDQEYSAANGEGETKGNQNSAHLQPIHLVRIQHVWSVSTETAAFPLGVAEEKGDQALDIRLVDVMQTPVEHIHQDALYVPVPVPISVDIGFGDGC